jgi:hypothetical protein
MHINHNTNAIIPFDNLVIRSVNNLLGTNSNFFPLNLHWIINKKIYTKLVEYLNSRVNNINYIDFILTNSNLYFEIILYNFYLINFCNDNNNLNIIDYTHLSIKYNEYFLFNMKLNDDEILEYNAHIAIASYVNRDKSKYLIKVHNDRW